MSPEFRNSPIKGLVISFVILGGSALLISTFYSWKIMLALCGVGMFLINTAQKDAKDSTLRTPAPTGFSWASGVLAIIFVFTTPPNLAPRVNPTSGVSPSALDYMARRTVRAALKDPDSANFRNTFFSELSGPKVICGEVNSKNSLGGYSGFQSFVFDDEKFNVLEETQGNFLKSGANPADPDLYLCLPSRASVKGNFNNRFCGESYDFIKSRNYSCNGFWTPYSLWGYSPS